MMSNTSKKLDAVQMMRTIRKTISSKIENMTLEEERHWLASHEFGDPLLQRLQEKADEVADGLCEATRSKTSLQDVMRDISKNAAEQGLTPEILQSFLDEQ